MCPLDERIMEILDREGWSTARLIEDVTTMNASEDRAHERLQLLSEAGLVAPIYEDASMYELTGEGQRYLDGDLDAAKHVERPNPHAV
jgi:predicted transcriptional regulator